MTKAIGTILMLMLVFASSASGVFAEDPSEPNAASFYKVIWDASQREYVDSRGLHLETQTLGEPGWTPGPIVTSELSNPERLRRIEAAVAIGHCDFEFDYSVGPNLLLPHHSKMTNSATLLLADAQIRITQHEYALASERIVQALKIAEHFENQEFIMAALARMDIAGTAAKIVRLAPEGSWNDEHAASMFDSIERFSGEDPFGLRTTALLESEHFADWVIACDRSPKGHNEFFDFADMVEYLDGGKPVPTRPRYVLLVLLHGGLQPCAEGYRQAARDQIKALNTDDREAAYAEFTEQLMPPILEYGPIAPAFLPGLDRSLEREAEALEQISRMRNILGVLEK